MLRNVFLYVISLSIVLIMLFCSGSGTNPPVTVDPRDYNFAPIWEQLPETLQVFTPYQIDVVYGSDPLDTIISDSLLERNLLINKIDETLTLYFTDAFSGEITLSGVADGTEIEQSHSVTVLNPWSIEGQGFWENDSAIVYSAWLNGPRQQGLSVAWTASLDTFEKSIEDTLIYAAVNVERCLFTAAVHDIYGNSIQLVPDTVTAPEKIVIIEPAAQPYFSTSKADTSVYINDTVTLSATADPGESGETITEYLWRWGDSSWTNTIGTTQMVFTAAAEDTVQVNAVNSLGDTTETPLVYAVSVLEGAPVVSLVALDRDTVDMQEGVNLSVSAHDVNGVITALEIDTSENDTADITITDLSVDSLNHTELLTFPDSGNVTIGVRVIDEDGIASMWVQSESLRIRYRVKPQIDSVAPDTVWESQNFSIKIHARDNGTVTAFASSGDGEQFSEYRSGTLLDTALSTVGWNHIWFMVRDNDGMESPLYHDSIYVKSNKPIIDTVELDMADADVYVKDRRIFTVTARSPFYSLRKIYVDYNNDDVIDDSASLNVRSVTRTFAHTYAVADSGDQLVRIWAKDSNNKISDVYEKAISVNVGAPTMSAITINPTTVYINDNTTITVTSLDENGSAQQWYVQKAAGEEFVSLGNKSGTVVWDSEGTYMVRAFVRDDDGLSSDTISREVVVNEGTPSVTGISFNPTQVYINDPVTITVSSTDENPGGSAVQWFIKEHADSTFDTISTNSGSFMWTEAGTYTVSAYVIDDDGNVSETENAQVTVGLGKPSVTGFTFEPSEIYINATVQVTIASEDENPDSSIKQWFVKEHTDSTFDTLTRDNINFIWADSGTYTVSAYVIDDDGVASDVASVEVTVLLGEPVLNDLGINGTDFWINDDISYALNSTDPSGNVVSQYFETQAGGGFSSVGASGKLNYSTPGTYTVRAYVVDNDGNSSDTVAHEITINRGEPTVTGFTFDTDPIYLNDSVTFTIGYTDPNAESIEFWVKKQLDSNYVEFDALTGKLAWDTSGEYVCSVYVVDDDLNKSNVLGIPVTVHLGAPVIDSINIDTVWVVDDNTYEIFAHDVNPGGTLDSFEISFDDGANWLTADSAKFEYGWDTSSAGTQDVHVRVMDDDSTWVSEVFEVVVRLGRPIVSLADFGDSIQIVPGAEGELDTMFYVYKGGSGAHTAMAIDTSDTNGQCVTYYWDTDNDGDYNIENNVPYLSYDFGKLESEISVWAADEDGIMSEKVTFYLYPDDPPLEVEASVVPADLNPTTKYTFSWSGMDVKDQTLT